MFQAWISAAFMPETELWTKIGGSVLYLKLLTKLISNITLECLFFILLMAGTLSVYH